MSRGYKVNEAINFRLRCNGDPATDNPTVVVFDEVDGVFATLTIGAGLTQIGSTRLVKGTFTPDAEGEWSTHAYDDEGLELIKQYSVGQHSISSNGAKAASIEAKIDAQDILATTRHNQILAAINSIGGGGGHFG